MPDLKELVQQSLNNATELRKRAESPWMYYYIFQQPPKDNDMVPPPSAVNVVVQRACDPLPEGAYVEGRGSYYDLQLWFNYHTTKTGPNVYRWREEF